MKYSFIALAISIGLIPVLILHKLNPIYLVALGTGIVSIVLYIWLQKRVTAKGHKEHITCSTWTVGAISLESVALAAWVNRAGDTKPLDYYVIIACAAAFLFGATLTTENTRQTRIVCTIICSIGLMHIWTESLMFPSLIGLDPWTHMARTVWGLAEAGINGNPPLILKNIGGSYSLMHIYLQGVMSAFHLDYRMAALVFWSSMITVGNLIFIYLLGKELINRRTGLIAALLAANAGSILFFGEWAIPNSIGVTLSLIAAYLCVKAYRTRRYWIAALSGILLPIAFLTNIIDVAWVLGTITVMVTTLAIMKRRRLLALPITAILAFGIWYNTSYMKRALASIVASGFDSSILSTAVGSSSVTRASGSGQIVAAAQSIKLGEITPSINTLSNLRETTINSIGMFLFFGLGLIGILFLLRHSSLRKIWALFCLGILAMGFLPPLLGISFIEHRWWYLGEAFLSIPLAIALLRLHRVSRNITLPLITALVFLSTIGFPSNLTNRTLSPHQVVRYALTEKEMKGLQLLGSLMYNGQFIVPDTIGTDPLYGAYARALQYKAVSIDNAILTGDFTDAPFWLLLRDSLNKEPFGYGSGTIYELQYDPVQAATDQGYEDVWQNGEIHLLMKGQK